MSVLYELAIYGMPSNAQVEDVSYQLSSMIEPFGLRLGEEVSLLTNPAIFQPLETNSSAVIFFGGKGARLENHSYLVSQGIPILPVVSDVSQVSVEIPTELRGVNCLSYTNGAERIASALLECVGLLPRQRRVFLSYKREEAKEAALQLFECLSSKLFDVFLDTHGVAPAEDFQTILWHRLCDSDVLIMLDTPNYFESRWTSAEFGRALAKGISVLRVGWPDSTPSARTATASRAELLFDEVDPVTGKLSEIALARISSQLERVRSQSNAVRSLNLVSHIKNSITTIGGEFLGVGLGRSLNLKLPDGRKILVHPTVGVPTSTTMHEAMRISPHGNSAIVYDPIGLNPKWLDHLDWLGSHVKNAKWLKFNEAAWQLADWEV